MGFTAEEVLDLLRQEKKNGPWIPYEFPPRKKLHMDPAFHQVSCVHQFVHHESRSMRSLTSDIKRMIARICGLGGVFPIPGHSFRRARFNDSTAYISYGNSGQGEPDESQLIQGALEHCQLVLVRITDLCDSLQYKGWVCIQIVALEYDQEFRSAAIPFSLIAQLQECVDEALSRHSLQENPQNRRLFDTALDLLGVEASASLSTSYGLETAVDLCALAVQMISVSLLSISEAHVGAVRPFFLDRPITKIYLCGNDGPMSKSLKLGIYLGGLGC